MNMASALAQIALPDADASGDKNLVRFITCGSVDDGKSTLIGRLLFDSKSLLADQVEALERESRVHGTTSEGLDFALLVDGLSAEREQGITIDVAYRMFETANRRFIVADTPGHEQYTRNMITGASTADAAIILVDARKGVLTQTRRHSYLCHLVGIRNVVLAVNKMDLVGYSRERFDEIVEDYRAFAESLGIANVVPIPLCGLSGENVATRCPKMHWHHGPTLLDYLESVVVDGERLVELPFTMVVQWVNRPNSSFRGFSGLVTTGLLCPGDAVRVLPSGRTTTIERIVTMDGDLPAAAAGQAVTVTFTDEVDCARGDVLSASADPIEVADQFEATLVWLGEDPMLPQRPYLLKMGANTVPVRITDLKYQVDVNTLGQEAGKTLPLNGIGVVNLAADRALPFMPYARSADLGGFIIIDRLTNNTVGAGMIHFALRRSHNIQWQALEVSREAHAAQKAQQPKLLWFTGLSGSGKSTIANLVEKKLLALGKHSFLLDGDNVRHGLCRDLGFTDADRVENVRRVAEVARLMTDAGLIVLTAFISPFRAERDMVRGMFGRDFIEIHVDTPLDVAEMRDVKGLYRKAREGALRNFTGIDSPYEAPEAPDLRIDTTAISPEEAAEQIVALLLER